MRSTVTDGGHVSVLSQNLTFDSPSNKMADSATSGVHCYPVGRAFLLQCVRVCSNSKVKRRVNDSLGVTQIHCIVLEEQRHEDGPKNSRVGGAERRMIMQRSRSLSERY